MKKLFYLLSMLVLGFPQVMLAQNVILSGNITYDNTYHSAIHSVIVKLYQADALLAIDTVNSSGYYEFSVPANSDYKIVPEREAGWGGGGNTDALAILRHFTGMSLLEGIRLQAADVNGNQYVNSLDALLIAERFVQLITVFPGGNWVFEHPTVSVQATDITVNLKGLCVGDVNGSWTPQ